MTWSSLRLSSSLRLPPPVPGERRLRPATTAVTSPVTVFELAAASRPPPFPNAVGVGLGDSPTSRAASVLGGRSVDSERDAKLVAGTGAGDGISFVACAGIGGGDGRPKVASGPPGSA